MKWRWLLLLLGLTLIRELLYLTVTPAFQGPDEPGHFEYIALLQRLGRVPLARPDTEIDPDLTRAINAAALVQNFEIYRQVSLRRASEQEPPLLAGPREAGYQDPLYYQLLEPVYAAAARGGLSWAYYATAAASSGLALLVTAAAAFMARELFPDDAFAQRAVPLLVAFWPTQTYMMSRLNNDNLATAAGALGLWLMVVLLRRGLNLWTGLALAGMAWLAVSVKGTTLFILPVLGLAGLIAAVGYLPPAYRRPANWGLAAAGGLGVALGLGALYRPDVARGLLWLVQSVPGESRPEAWLVGALSVLTSGAHWLPERVAVNQAETLVIGRRFFAAFAWGQTYLAPEWYLAAALSAGLAVVGVGVRGLRRLQGALAPALVWRRQALGLAAAAIGIAWIPLYARMLTEPFAPYWHGRSLLPILPAAAALLVFGWSQWLPARWRPAGVRGLLLLLLVLDAASLALTIIPAFYG